MVGILIRLINPITDGVYARSPKGDALKDGPLRPRADARKPSELCVRPAFEGL